MYIDAVSIQHHGCHQYSIVVVITVQVPAYCERRIQYAV